MPSTPGWSNSSRRLWPEATGRVGGSTARLSGWRSTQDSHPAEPGRSSSWRAGGHRSRWCPPRSRGASWRWRCRHVRPVPRRGLCHGKRVGFGGESAHRHRVAAAGIGQSIPSLRRSERVVGVVDPSRPRRGPRCPVPPREHVGDVVRRARGNGQPFAGYGRVTPRAREIQGVHPPGRAICRVRDGRPQRFVPDRTRTPTWSTAWSSPFSTVGRSTPVPDLGRPASRFPVRRECSSIPPVNGSTPRGSG